MMENTSPRSSKPRKRGRSRRRRRSVNSNGGRRRAAQGFWSFSFDTDDEDDNDDDEVYSTNDNICNSEHRHVSRGVEPFGVTFLKVGVTLFLLSAVSYTVFLRSFYLQQGGFDERSSSRLVREQQRPIKTKPRNKRGPFQKESLASLTKYDPKLATMDAYGIASAYQLDYPPKEVVELSNQTTSETTLDASATSSSQPTVTATNNNAAVRWPDFVKLASQRRSQFISLVGGEPQARATLQRSLVTVLPPTTTKKGKQPSTPSSCHSHGPLVHRLRSLVKQKGQQETEKDAKPIFSVVVLGSSAAAGSGNYFKESYAFVLERLLSDLFGTINIDLQVKNLALEHTSEFPSLWCSKATMDRQIVRMPDIVVWDYGLTSQPEAFEAFLRNIASWKDHNDDDNRFPFLILRDTKIPNNNEHRDALLQTYVDHNAILDPVLVHLDEAAAPYLDLANDVLPEGFQDWTTSFGGPQGAPGKEHTHLTVKQHTMTAWLISMHLLSALELVVASKQDHAGDAILALPPGQGIRKRSISLPPPVVIQQVTKERWTLGKDEELIDKTPPAWLPLLIGQLTEKPDEFRSGDETKATDVDQRYMAPHGLQCHSSYITPHAADTLDELIISGPVENLWGVGSLLDNKSEKLDDLLLPKGKQFFTKGWVQDLDKDTKRRKQMSKSFNYLGFQDMIKQAYHGLPTSGDLTLFIPLSESQSNLAKAALRSTGIIPARDVIETVLICEADVPQNIVPSDADRDQDGACRLHKDTLVYVGGSMTFLETIPSGVSSSCVFINVPDSANLMFKKDVVEKAAKEKAKKESSPIPSQGENDHTEDARTVGLSIQISVRSDRGSMKVPCTVAHVLWNEVSDDDR